MYQQLQYQQISNPFVAPSAYGSTTNPYSMPGLSHIQSGDFKHQPLASGYEVSSGNANPINKLADCPVKPQRMTPQEKIEKLRRQQIQAMLAIQKQQQQLVHQKCSQENQIQHVEGADLEVEDLSTLASFDPNSPIEQDDSNTVSLAVNDYSMEDTVLYRLQDIISKLDVRIRLCIRDSLFRLAQSAMQRHYASDTGSTNNSSRDEQVAAKEETSSQRSNPCLDASEDASNNGPADEGAREVKASQ
ncbi:hypothetical protein POPTR_T126606v4 [Populus trichocarpa]|uniref:Uncharacterized protein n=2 Tax=Populus trichocarpa TaxID=3694 RepID=A0ACC0RJU8_POPTR|nr:hypothetical protein POPTR_T126606v4 [Populus trichocarpa]